MKPLQKVFFAIVITLLLGALGYLGYIYLQGAKKTTISQSENNAILNEAQASNFIGKIECIDNYINKAEKVEPGKPCVRFGILTIDGKTYQLAHESNIELSNYLEFKKVSVLGQYMQSIGPIKLDGIIYVFDISAQ